MMTKTSSQSRFTAMWFILFAILCCMIVPSFALANKEMTIATEGDPGDGLGATGGGGSILDQGNGDSSWNTQNDLELNKKVISTSAIGVFNFPLQFQVFVIIEMGNVKFVIEFWDYSNTGASR